MVNIPFENVENAFLHCEQKLSGLVLYVYNNSGIRVSYSWLAWFEKENVNDKVKRTSDAKGREKK